MIAKWLNTGKGKNWLQNVGENSIPKTKPVEPALSLSNGDG